MPGPSEGSRPTFATNVMFVPGYRNGVAPFGTYAGVTERAPALWSFEALLDFDVGAINLAPAAGGKIENALGSRGVSFNRPDNAYKKNRTRFRVFGYPAQPSAFYDGERPILCHSPFKRFENLTGALVTGPCNMKEGSSGGGWVLGGGILNSVVSHNSCGVSPACNRVSGTYFGSIIYKLWSVSGGGIAKGRKKKIHACKRRRGARRLRCQKRVFTFKPSRR
jgi:hypothetical protein